MEPSDRHIALIGMMGVGKTTVGRLLAARLGREFWDNDEGLERETGRTAADVKREQGQAALHRLESRLLREAPQSPEGQHIAASRQHHRPLPADALATLEALAAQRAARYAQVADVQVDVAGGPEATCDRVLEALAARRSRERQQPGP